jgi:drug/metabolite transporter (DMT)-like permease
MSADRVPHAAAAASSAAPATHAAAPLLPVLVITLVWGTTWPLFPLAVREMSVWTFRAVSVLCAAALLMAWCRWRGLDLRIPRRHWATVASAAVVYLGIWNIASTYAAVLIPSGQAALLGFTMPIWAALGARIFFGERLQPRALAAIGLSGLGVLLLLAKGWSAYAAAPAGFALGLLAGIGWAGGTLILKRHPVPVPSEVLTAWQLLAAGVPCSLLALLLGDHHGFVPSAGSLAVIAYITVMPMAVGNVVWFTIVKRVPAHLATLSPVLVPVVAMISGAVVRGEPLGLYEGVAMACCAAGLVLGLRR